MNAVEFTTELGPDRVLLIPESAAGQVPTSGTARVIVLIGDDPEDARWHAAAYQQFLAGDDPGDDIYGSCE